MKKQIEISPYGSLLVYKNYYTRDDIRYIIQEKNLKGLRIFIQLKEEKLPDLNFLSEYSFLEALDITSVEDYDFSFLANLSNLKNLSIISEGKNIIDLSNQINLENLTIKWRKGQVSGLENCSKIIELCLVEYTEKDIKPISSLINLLHLKIKTASLKDLDGIEKIKKLRTLLLGNCNQLISIDKLQSLSNLTSLHFESCAKIYNFNEIGNLLSLESLAINDCKAVFSINFIKNIPSLKWLSLLGNTNIVDGDLIPAENIKDVYYKQRKHYNRR
ncbi:hypothetical protein [Sphingobacterium faecium]|uniref:hypothetical protein n=1 Tax=Sphingobacterium faecium TaxID=34087 RepID=UPI003DA3935B